MSIPSSMRLATLQHFERLLGEERFPTSIARVGPGIPEPVLIVGLSGTDDSQRWQLELSFVPGMEEHLQGASLLQCFARLSSDVAETAESELLRAIATVNSRLPLEGFSYLARERMVCFRHVLMLPGLVSARDLLTRQSVWLIAYLLTVFSPTIEAVAAGRQSSQEALNENQFRALFGE